MALSFWMSCLEGLRPLFLARKSFSHALSSRFSPATSILLKRGVCVGGERVASRKVSE